MVNSSYVPALMVGTACFAFSGCCESLLRQHHAKVSCAKSANLAQLGCMHMCSRPIVVNLSSHQRARLLTSLCCSLLVKSTPFVSATMCCQHVVDLHLQVKLLQFVRPQDFENFRHFVRWRDTTANILLQILTRAAQVPVSDDDKYGTHLLLSTDQHLCCTPI